MDVLIGLKSSSLLGRQIQVEQLGGIHSPILPNINIMKTILSPNLIVTGIPGIDRNLTKPTLLIHKSMVEQQQQIEINKIRVDLWESSEDEDEASPKLVIDLSEDEEGIENSKTEVQKEYDNNHYENKPIGNSDCEIDIPQVKSVTHAIIEEKRDENEEENVTLVIGLNPK